MKSNERARTRGVPAADFIARRDAKVNIGEHLGYGVVLRKFEKDVARSRVRAAAD
jgi:hypothetical protein